MNKLGRANLVLLGILVLQFIVLIALPGEGASTGRSGDDAAVAGRQPYSALDVAQARSVTITAADGKVVKLEATTKKEGEKDVTAWTLANRDRYPARASEVEKIVEAAKKIRLTRVVTRQEKQYARLNVADGVMHARVQIAGEGGKPLADFRLGDSKDFNSVSFRMEGDPAVYEATGGTTYEFPVAVAGLVETSFLDLPADQVVRVKITNGAEMYEVIKEMPESRPTSQPESQPDSAASRGTETKPEPKWVVAGSATKQTLDKVKVESWIRGLTRINLSDPIGTERKPEYGFEKPTASATLTMADGSQTTITVGAERKDQHDSYLTATGKEFVVTVPAWNVTDQFQKKLKDLEPGGPPTGDVEPPGHEGHGHR